MRATEILKQEHRVIESALDALEKVTDNLETGAQIDADKAEKILEMLRNFADKIHHAKEELQLFDLLAQRGLPAQAGPLAVMTREHEEGRAHIRKMLEALPGAARKDVNPERLFTRHARTCIDLLRQHIQKEDNVLFPTADRSLAQEDDAQLLQAFEEFSEEMPAGEYERYRQWAEELKQENE